MNEDHQKEFFKFFINPEKNINDKAKSLSVKKLHSEILKSLSNLPKDYAPEQIENFDIDIFFATCKESGIEPIDVLEDFLNIIVSHKSNFKFEGKEFSIEGLPDFFSKAKENFTKQKESEDINNF
jgi:hypothetical protein